MLLMMFAVSGGLGQSELIINPEGDSQTRALGDSILFTCIVSHLGQGDRPNIRWFDKEGREIFEVSGRLVSQSSSLPVECLHVGTYLHLG